MNIVKYLAAGIAALCLSTAVAAESPSNEELQRRLNRLEQQIEALKQAIQQQASDTNARALRHKIRLQQKRINALAERVAQQATEVDRTNVGGYGELHYNNSLEGGGARIDFHRFVLEFSHAFNDDWRFFSELEFEHAFIETTEIELEHGEIEEVERTPGELKIEQAYIEHDLGGLYAVQAGLALVPAGLLTESHHPTTFYGVERNRVETRIIPSTWRAAGVKLIRRPGPLGLSFQLFLHTGLGLHAEPDFAIEEGPQTAAEALANDFAITGEVEYTGIPGVLLGATLQYQDDVSQHSGDGLGHAWFYSVHADIRRGPFGFRAVAARWNFSGPVAENNGRETQYGWYVEPSYRLTEAFGVFARYGELSEHEDRTEENFTVGFNYWPIPNIVFKVDYQERVTELPGPDIEADSFNVGIGYVFP